jgi:queuosine precursor transporter
MNEFIFLLQILLITAFTFGALKLGKEALIGWIALQALIANLFVIKQIALFGFEVTASDPFAVGSLLALSFLQEYFGQEEAKKASRICFFFLLFFTLASQIHLLYLPSVHDASQDAFLTLLSPTPRLFIASLAVFFIVQQLDIRFFSLIKTRFPIKSFAFRAGIALVFSQALDTVLFSYAGLYGIAASMADVIIMSLTIKLLITFCFTPFLRLSR